MTPPKKPPDRYVVLGHPVEHSRSPFIHALFAEQTHQHLRYDRQLCALDGFEAAVRQFAQDGGRGCNVTVPFKFDALALATHPTARAQRAGAANVLAFDGDRWTADNTDGVGLVHDIQIGAGMPLKLARVLLVGAGGAAAGVLGPLLQCQPAQVVVCNRTPAKAMALVDSHAAWARQHNSVLQGCGLTGLGSDRFDVVINASSSSLQGAASPVPASVLGPGTLAVDLMYGAAAQPWLDWAQAQGAQPRDGLGMLVEQAAEAFFLWRGVRPQTAPVLQALRASVQARA